MIGIITKVYYCFTCYCWDAYRNHKIVTKQDDVQENEDLELDIDPILNLIHSHPENITAPSAKTPLTEAELQGSLLPLIIDSSNTSMLEIGLQATQLIADSSEPLATLTRLSQNFPKYATSLARRVVVNSSLETEIHENSLKAQGGTNLFWINGAAIPEKDVNPLGLLRLLRKERAVMLSLAALGIPRPQVLELLTHPSISASQAGKNVLDGLFDASDRPEKGEVITWWNDIEKDSRYGYRLYLNRLLYPSCYYSGTPSGARLSLRSVLKLVLSMSRSHMHVTQLLRPVYPGQFPSVKLNLYNIVLVVDLSQTSSLTFIGGPVANIINRNFPLRFGVVPIAETEEGIYSLVTRDFFVFMSALC